MSTDDRVRPNTPPGGAAHAGPTEAKMDDRVTRQADLAAKPHTDLAAKPVAGVRAPTNPAAKAAAPDHAMLTAHDLDGGIFLSSSAIAITATLLGITTIALSMALMLAIGESSCYDTRWPYISDAGASDSDCSEAAQLIFAGGLALTSFLIFLTVLSTGSLLRRQAFTMHSSRGRKLAKASRWITVLGAFAAISLFLLAIINVDAQNVVHNIFAISFFFCMAVWMFFVNRALSKVWDEKSDAERRAVEHRRKERKFGFLSLSEPARLKVKWVLFGLVVLSFVGMLVVWGVESATDDDIAEALAPAFEYLLAAAALLFNMALAEDLRETRVAFVSMLAEAHPPTDTKQVPAAASAVPIAARGGAVSGGAVPADRIV